MFKWFKERKKRRKSAKQSKHSPEDDDDEHIYAEIVDLPRLANVEGWVRDVNNQSAESDSEKNQSEDELDPNDPGGGGPYMVVPLIAGRRNKTESESLTSFSSTTSSSKLSRQESVASGSAESTSSAADVSYDSGTCQRSESNSDHDVISSNGRDKTAYGAGSSLSDVSSSNCRDKSSYNNGSTILSFLTDVNSSDRRGNTSYSAGSSVISSLTDGSCDSGALMASNGKIQQGSKNPKRRGKIQYDTGSSTTSSVNEFCFGDDMHGSEGKTEEISKGWKNQKRRNKNPHSVGVFESSSVDDFGKGTEKSAVKTNKKGQRSEGKGEQVSKSQRRKNKNQSRTGSSGSSSVGDSCFEYDVKTSSDDEQINDYVISKMRENLQLKYSLQETVRVRTSSDSLDQKPDAVISGVFCDSADVDVTLSLSNQDADDGTLADQSDSDNSSGYYDSSLRKRDRVQPAFRITSANSGETREKGTLYDTPDMGTICLSINANIENLQRPRKLERSRIKTVCIPKVFDINIEPKSAFRPVHSSKPFDGAISRTLSYKRNSSVSSSLKPNEFHKDIGKLGETTKLTQRSRSMDNLHILTSATCGKKATRLSTPACQRKFSQLSLAPASCLFESIDKEVPDVSNFFANTSTGNKSSSEVYSLPNFVPIEAPKRRPEVAKSRDVCSTDIYRSPGRNNRLLSDLIMSNYSQRQFVVR